MTPGLETRLQELLLGATGGRDAERLREPQAVPEHAADRTVMLRCLDIAVLGRDYGAQPLVQGLIAGIAISADLFEIRQSAVFAAGRCHQSLADLAIVMSLKDSDSWMRVEMLRHLCCENALSAISAAVHMASHDPEESVRIDAMELLLDVDTERALDLARALVAESHQHQALRDYCEKTLKRTDLQPFVKEEAGHLISPDTECRAELLNAALFAEEVARCLEAAQQLIAEADDAAAVAIGFVLLSHRSTQLRELGYQTISSCSPEVARLLRA